MSIKRQVGLIILCYLWSFAFIRHWLFGVKIYALNRSAYRKRKKGETFSEWFWYKRYRKEIPRIMLFLYYFIVFMYPLALIVCLILYWVGASEEIGTIIAIDGAGFTCAWMLIMEILFWSPGRDFAFGRWIKRKGGNRKKKYK